MTVSFLEGHVDVFVDKSLIPTFGDVYYTQKLLLPCQARLYKICVLIFSQ